MTHHLYHEQRFARVIAHLHEHYAESLDLQRLAEEACLSPCHWHRIYRAVMGETIHDTLKRIRLQRAAWLLTHSGQSIASIARAVGYGGNAQSFTRIFRAHYAQSPADYRTRQRLPYPQRGDAPVVELRHLDPIPVILLDHRGDYMQIGDTFHRLYSLMHLRGEATNARSFGIYHDCPEATPEAERFAQAAVAGETPAAAPLYNGTIRGGLYAVMRHRGPYAELESAYDWLYRDWLLQSPHEIADAPPVEEYLNDVQTTAPQDLLTDICIPLTEGEPP